MFINKYYFQMALAIVQRRAPLNTNKLQKANYFILVSRKSLFDQPSPLFSWPLVVLTQWHLVEPLVRTLNLLVMIHSFFETKHKPFPRTKGSLIHRCAPVWSAEESTRRTLNCLSRCDTDIKHN